MINDYKKLHEDICFKRAEGKVIWQPRIDCWINDKIFDTGELPGIYKGMSKCEIYKELGCSARIYEYNDCFREVWDDTVVRKSSTQGRETTYSIETPVGTVTRVVKSTPSSWASLVTKEWVETEEDLAVYSYIEAHSSWEWNQEHYDKTYAEWGNLGAPCVFIPRVNMQRLYIDLMGVENAVYALADFPEAVEEYFKVLHDSQFRLLEIINKSPINIINFGDNIHSGTLSPSLFEEYVLEEYKQRCAKLHEAGKFVYSHFDGNNQGLMHFYSQTGLDGIEAITPKPQGDVELTEVKPFLKDMFLIDGIPAVYFDETYPVEVLTDCVKEILELFAPNLILGISDEISSTGDIERVRLVGELVDRYNEAL